MFGVPSIKLGECRRNIAGSLLATIALSACGSNGDSVTPPPPPLVPSTVGVVSGDHQAAAAGHVLTDPLIVQVTTSNGTPVPNASVDWSVTGGSGTLSSTSSLSDQNGKASVTWTLGRAAGGQAVKASLNTAPSSAATFSATVAAPVLLHFDGTTWSVALKYNGEYAWCGVTLQSIWGASGSEVFAGGGFGSCGLLGMRYDGTAWNDISPCPGMGSGFASVSSISGNSGSDVFAVCRSPLPPRLATMVSHYDGTSWSSSYLKNCMLCVGLRAVWSRSATDAFAVGDSGEVLRYTGTGWSPQSIGTVIDLNALWGDAATPAVFAVGAAGTILNFDGAAWHAQTSGTTQTLNAVWGSSANNVYAVGAGGTILHFDGNSWTAQSSGTSQSLNGIWGGSGSSVFAVGNGGVITHYDGSTWTAQTVSGLSGLGAVWGTSATNVFAVGGTN